jgi:hypothetical protein
MFVLKYSSTQVLEKEESGEDSFLANGPKLLWGMTQ